jgi:hypothetical protein
MKKKAWVISLSSIDAQMFSKNPKMEGLKVLSLISARKRNRYVEDCLKNLWQFLRMDWYGLEGSFNLDTVSKSFDQKVKNKDGLIYIHESSYTLQAERSKIKKIEVHDLGKYSITWKPDDYVEMQIISNHPFSKIVEVPEKSASIVSVDMRDFF